MLQNMMHFWIDRLMGIFFFLGNYAAHNTHFQTGALKLPTSRL